MNLKESQIPFEILRCKSLIQDSGEIDIKIDDYIDKKYQNLFLEPNEPKERNKDARISLLDDLLENYKDLEIGVEVVNDTASQKMHKSANMDMIVRSITSSPLTSKALPQLNELDSKHHSAICGNIIRKVRKRKSLEERFSNTLNPESQTVENSDYQACIICGEAKIDKDNKRLGCFDCRQNLIQLLKRAGNSHFLFCFTPKKCETDLCISCQIRVYKDKDLFNFRGQGKAVLPLMKILDKIDLKNESLLFRAKLFRSTEYFSSVIQSESFVKNHHVPSSSDLQSLWISQDTKRVCSLCISDNVFTYQITNVRIKNPGPTVCNICSQCLENIHPLLLKYSNESIPECSKHSEFLNNCGQCLLLKVFSSLSHESSDAKHLDFPRIFGYPLLMYVECDDKNQNDYYERKLNNATCKICMESVNAFQLYGKAIVCETCIIVFKALLESKSIINLRKRYSSYEIPSSTVDNQLIIDTACLSLVFQVPCSSNHDGNSPVWSCRGCFARRCITELPMNDVFIKLPSWMRRLARRLVHSKHHAKRKSCLPVPHLNPLFRRNRISRSLPVKQKNSKKYIFYNSPAEFLPYEQAVEITSSFEFLYRTDEDGEDQENLSNIFTTDYSCTDTCSESEIESREISVPERKSNLDDITSQPSPSVDSMKSDDGSSVFMEETRSKRQRKMTSRLLDYLSDIKPQERTSLSSESSSKHPDPPFKQAKNKRVSESLPSETVERKQPRVKQATLVKQTSSSQKVSSTTGKRPLNDSQDEILSTMVKAAQMAAVSVKVPDAPSPESAASKALKGYYQQQRDSNSKVGRKSKSTVSLHRNNNNSLLDDDSSEMENVPEVDSDENMMLHDDMIFGADGSALPRRCGQCPPCKGLVKPCLKCPECLSDPTTKNTNCLRLVCYRRKNTSRPRKNGPRVKMPTLCSPTSGKPRVLQSSQLHNQPLSNANRPSVSLLQTVDGLGEVLKSDDWLDSVNHERSSPTESAKGTIFGSSNKIVSGRLHVHAPDTLTKKSKTIPGGDLNLLHGGRYEVENSLKVTETTNIRQVDGEKIDSRLSMHGGFPIVSTKEGQPPKEICYSCGSGGGQLIFCHSCAEPFHFYCIDRQFRPKKKDDFTCQNCCSCSLCSKPSVELKCATCIKYFHQRCLESYAPAQVDKIITSFFCPDCTTCEHCRCTPKDTSVYEMRVGVPISSLNHQQHNDDEENKSMSCLVPWSVDCAKCALCHESQAKGSVCPECDHVYTDETSQMFQCDHCDLWIHRSCAKFTYDQYNLVIGLTSAELAKFKILCSICRKEKSISGEISGLLTLPPPTSHTNDNELEGEEKRMPIESDNDLLREHVQGVLKKKINTFINYCTLTSEQDEKSERYRILPQVDGANDMSDCEEVINLDECHDFDDELEIDDMEGIEMPKQMLHRPRKQSLKVPQDQHSPAIPYSQPVSRTQYTNNNGSSKKKHSSKAGYPPCPMHVDWLLLPEELQIGVTSKFIIIPPLVRVMHRLDMHRHGEIHLVNSYRKLLKWLLGLIEYLFPWLPIAQIISEIKERMLDSRNNTNKILTSLFNVNKLELFETACPIVSRSLEMVANCLATNSMTYHEKAKYIHSAINHLEEKHGKLVKNINSLLCPSNVTGRDWHSLTHELVSLLHRAKTCHRLNSIVTERARILKERDDAWIQQWSRNEEEIATLRFQSSLAESWKRQLSYWLENRQEEIPSPAYLSVIWNDFSKKLENIKNSIVKSHSDGIPVNLENLFRTIITEEEEVNDERCCLFCGYKGDDSIEGRLIYVGCDSWIHINCALWSNEVFESPDGRLSGLSRAIRRAAVTQCSDCGKYGATLTCSNPQMTCPIIMNPCSKVNTSLTCVHFVCSLRRRSPLFKSIFTVDRSWFCSPLCLEEAKTSRIISKLDSIRRKRQANSIHPDSFLSMGRIETDPVIFESDISSVRENVESTLMPLFFGALMVCRRVFVPSNCLMQALSAPQNSVNDQNDSLQRYRDGLYLNSCRNRISLAILDNLFVSSRTIEMSSTRGLPSVNIVITIGALCIERLGHLREASDSLGSIKRKHGLLCPVGYRARRYFWSHIHPNKRASYTLNISQVFAPDQATSEPPIEISVPFENALVNRMKSTRLEISSNIGFKRCRPKANSLNHAANIISVPENKSPIVKQHELPVMINGNLTSVTIADSPPPKKTINHNTMKQIKYIQITNDQACSVNYFPQKPVHPMNSMSQNIIRVKPLHNKNIMVIRQANSVNNNLSKSQNQTSIKIARPPPAVIYLNRPPNIHQLDGVYDSRDDCDIPLKLPRNRSNLEMLTASSREHLVQQELADRISKAKLANYERVIQAEIEKDASNYVLQFEVLGVVENANSPMDAWKEVVNSVSLLREKYNQKPMTIQFNGWTQFGLNHRHVVFLIEQLRDAYKCYRHRFQYHRKHVENIRKKIMKDLSSPINEGCARLKPWPKSRIIPNRHIADPLDFLLCKANPPPPLQHPNAQKLLENTPGILFSPTKGLTLQERTECISAARDAALSVSKRLGLSKVKENKMLLAAVTRATGLSLHALRELKGGNNQPLIDPQVLVSQLREDEELSDEANQELDRLFSDEEDEASDSILVQFEKMSSGPLARLNRISVHPSRIHGRGLFALKIFRINTVIVEYCGELIRNWVCETRESRYRLKGVDCYMFRVDKDYVVDATFSGNAARFINHSCQPNCYARVLTVNERKHIVIMALRQILPGEELTYDYRFPKEDEKLPCHCGSQGCRGFLN